MDSNPPAQKTPRKRADPTRKRILRAARQLFVKKGFAGTSISNIATTAKVNHSLIFHHFTNKAELWRAVKMDVIKSYENAKIHAIDANKGVSYCIRQVVMQLMGLYTAHPDLQRILAWQQLESDRTDLIATSSTSHDTWMQTIKELQQRGEINPELDVRLVMIMISSCLNGVFRIPDFQKKFPGITQQAYLDLIIDQLTVALRGASKIIP